MTFNTGFDLLVNHDYPVKLHTIPRNLLPVKLHGNVVMLSILLIIIQAIARDQETVKWDAGCSKLLSWVARCDRLKTSISTYQKKALGEPYRVVPLSSCTFNVCVSYAHFNFSRTNFNWTKMRRRSVCTALTWKVKIFAWRPFSETNCGMAFQYLL